MAHVAGLRATTGQGLRGGYGDRFAPSRGDLSGAVTRHDLELNDGIAHQRLHFDLAKGDTDARDGAVVLEVGDGWIRGGVGIEFRVAWWGWNLVRS